MSLSLSFPLLLLLAAGPGHTAHADALQKAIEATAVPLRSIDSPEEDFTDLEPVARAVGTARVVLLGEPSHGAGGAFAAKARLVRFLHQRMGFDVVAWESGLHGLQATEAAFTAGEDPVAAAKRGIFSIWSAAEQVRPLFEYVARTRGTTHPLMMAGFDIQFTAPGAVDYLAAGLREVFLHLDDVRHREESRARIDELFAALSRLHGRPQPPATTVPVTAEDLDIVVREADALRAILEAPPPAIVRVHPIGRIELLIHALAGLRVEARNAYERRRPDRPQGATRIAAQSAEWNRRDASMTANLLWLLQGPHRGRKIVVWGHNAHVTRGHFSPDWGSIGHEPVTDGMTPMGELLAQAIPGETWALGITTFDGEEAWVNGQKRATIAPAPPGSIEARLHAIGKPYLFLDLRALSRRLGSIPIGPVSMRITGFGPPTSSYGNDAVPDLGRTFDAVLFIDRMTPAVAIQGR